MASPVDINHGMEAAHCLHQNCWLLVRTKSTKCHRCHRCHRPGLNQHLPWPGLRAALIAAAMSVDDDCHGLDQQMLGRAQPRLVRRVLAELGEIGRLGVPLALSSASGNLNVLVTGR